MMSARCAAVRQHGSSAQSGHMPKAIWHDLVVAESTDTVVVEGNHYFPRIALREDLVRGSDTAHRLPVEGHGFLLLVGARRTP
ncbi:hypothetical protein GCM10027615_58540 [Plantactinospora veratri]